ncbi:MAG: 2-amino-4-hydroxy-6-hydroxymethyldihydropteridine diphosphokinase [Prevotella sp.]|nr:2-amino-4-hydroxy-6-hydroxymethyldihydropteridine diphosphokinase [Prevotella sp.]
MSGALHLVYLGLGSNLGDRQASIASAVRLIGERVGTVMRQSSLIETAPWGFESVHQFLNGVILCETALSPRDVLNATQQIERELGKTSQHATQRTNSQSYKDRPIDIDILLYDDLKVDEPGLRIPHPLMRERDFVMIPLQEIMENKN